VGPSLVTTSVTLPPKGRNHSARRHGSLTFLVRSNRNCIVPSLIPLGPIDFCLWAPSEPGKTVGEIEGEMIAWCSKPGHGTRLIPEGTLTGLQFLKTPDYIQLVGFMDQTKIDMVAGDFGGEMDPHGADLVRCFYLVTCSSF